MDRRYLTMIADLYGGGPVGVETLAGGLSEPRDTIEDVIEPYLIQLGLIARTARGRCLNGRGYTHLGLNPPPAPGRPVRPGSKPQVMSRILLTLAALVAAAPASAQPAAARAGRLFESGELALPAGPGGHLLDAARNDGAQPERLRVGRPEPSGEERADRLLLRLSDRFGATAG